MSILTVDDFGSGRWYIPVNPVQELGEVPHYINDVESEYLPLLLGVELYNLFMADYAILGTAPTDPIFTKIFDSLLEQTDDFILTSEGIKNMLKGFVYFKLNRDRISKITTVGIKKSQGVNSEDVSGIVHDLNSRYNQSVDTFKAIQTYIEIINTTDYPTYKGIDIDYSSQF